MEEIYRFFFKNLSCTRGVKNPDRILSRIVRCISNKDNRRLMERYSDEEVWIALKGIVPTKASGEYGFPTLFFQRCWHIVGPDVIAYCLNILNDGMNFDSLYVTNIVLISKPHHNEFRKL